MTVRPATSRQTYAIFCLRKKLGIPGGDTRNEGFTVETAKTEIASLIERANSAKSQKAGTSAALYASAVSAGNAAVAALVAAAPRVRARIVVRPVSDGVCGFAWVDIRPANCVFAKWLKENGIARKGYGTGLDVWISDFGQSLQKKEAYAHAFAEVLRDAGIDAYAESRLD